LTSHVTSGDSSQILVQKNLNKIQVQSVFTCSRTCFEHVQKNPEIFGYFHPLLNLS
jgi:hypothetical protein